MLAAWNDISNVSFYGSLALVIFVAVFIAIVIQAWLKPKAEIDRLSRMALSEELEPEMKSSAANEPGKAER